MASQIPQEIWWLVCQDLKSQQDFKGLFNCSLVCKSWAAYALPLLYSIHDSSSSDDVGTTNDGKVRWAGMWRSIILSSIGVTASPYCLWLKSLGLGDLQSLLLDIASNQNLRPRFFQGSMESFEITSRTTKTRFGKPILESQQIIEKVGDTITRYIKEAADEENKALQLTSLEGAFIPTPLLSIWTSRLPTLTTLSIQDGSVLTDEVAHSIRESCPSFKDLTCFNIRGPTVDENMSAFFRGLRENSLETFSVLSSNDIGYEALDGLMQHSASLRALSLLSLQGTSVPFLRLLSKCQYLEELEIEPGTIPPLSSWADDRDPLLEISIWLKENTHLKKLRIDKLRGASKLLSDVLKSPDLRLKELEVVLVDEEEGLYTALGNQTSLESLRFRSLVEIADSNNFRHDNLVESICACQALKDVNIMYSGIDITPRDLEQLKTCLPDLESLSFDGDLLRDDIFIPLAGMKALTTININGISVFTYEGIKYFLETVKATSTSGEHRRQGFRLYVMTQFGEAEILPEQASALMNLASQIPGGKFEFEYWRDPDEESVSDLSD